MQKCSRNEIKGIDLKWKMEYRKLLHQWRRSEGNSRFPLSEIAFDHNIMYTRIWEQMCTCTVATLLYWSPSVQGICCTFILFKIARLFLIRDFLGYNLFVPADIQKDVGKSDLLCAV